MSNINGINGYHGPLVVGSSPNVGAGSKDEPPHRATGAQGDRVEISQMARILGQVSALPEIRSEKVDSVRQALENGSYDVDGRLSEALDQFLEENLGL